jgi:hypothetical protein
VKTTKGSNSVSIDLDAPPEGTQALLERLGVQWTNLGATGAPTPGTFYDPVSNVATVVGGVQTPTNPMTNEPV